MNLQKKYSFEKITWLKQEPCTEIKENLKHLFQNIFFQISKSTEKNKLDTLIRNAFLSIPNFIVSELDEYRVYPDAKYTLDIHISTPDYQILIEIEKTEVKRVVHDFLKIAAVQKRNPNSIGILIVPSKYKTKNKSHSRTHLREAKAIIRLIEESLGWSGCPLAVVVYNENVINEPETIQNTKMKELVQSEKSEEKIGQFVKKTFRELFQKNRLNTEEINKLKNEKYSKEKFNINYPCLKEYNPSLQIKDQIRDGKYLRYWKEIFGNKYLICSQWYKESYPLVKKWLERLN